MPVHGIFVRGSRAVRLQSFQSILDGIPGLTVTWTPIYVGHWQGGDPRTAQGPGMMEQGDQGRHWPAERRGGADSESR